MYRYYSYKQQSEAFILRSFESIMTKYLNDCERGEKFESTHNRSYKE